jgi:hypothetical protein
MSEVDDRIMWLAGVLCMPTRRDAVRVVLDQTTRNSGFGAADMSKRTGTNNILRSFAERARPHDHVLALAFELLALSTDDSAAAAHLVAGANGPLCSADSDTSEARARLRVRDDAARGNHAGDDFFEIADRFWRSEMSPAKETDQ